MIRLDLRGGGGGGTNSDSILGAGARHLFLLILYNFKNIPSPVLRVPCPKVQAQATVLQALKIAKIEEKVTAFIKLFGP